MATKLLSVNKSQVAYGDLVVMDFSRDTEHGFPIKSFSCPHGGNMTEVIDEANGFIMDQKIKCMGNGDSIPYLKLGRVCCIKGTQDSAMDFAFQDHALGMKPTEPASVGGSLLASAIADFSKKEDE